MKFYTIKIFHAQQQRKDGKEVKFVNFGRERHEFSALRASTQQNPRPEAQRRKQKTEFRALQINIKYPESLELQAFHVILSIFTALCHEINS